jgi:transposase-like protein
VFPGSGNHTPEGQEVAELRKKLRRVTEERDILKKALAFFAEDES